MVLGWGKDSEVSSHCGPDLEHQQVHTWTGTLERGGRNRELHMALRKASLRIV